MDTQPLRTVDTHFRQLDVLNPADIENVIVTIIGAGALGSMTALILAKLGIRNFALYDFDTVEVHNLANQYHPASSIGMLKVESLKSEMLRHMPDINVQTFAEAYEGQRPLNGIVIVAVDSMAARKSIWEQVKFNFGIDLFIEARMGLEVLTVHTLGRQDISDMEQIAFYEGTLYSDEEADDAPCSAQSIIYTPAFAGGLMAKLVQRHLTGQEYNREIHVDIFNLMFA